VEHEGEGFAIEELRAALRTLEARVTRLEAGQATTAQTPAAPDEEAAGRPDERTTHGFLAGAAVVCFALVGALLLRTLARQGVLPAHLGPALGLSYCALLLLVPWLLRGVPHGPLLQACGGMLVPLVVLETYHRSRTITAGGATLILGAFLVGGALLAAAQRRGWLAGALILGPALALAGLGLAAPQPAWRAAALAGSVVVALALAHRLGWGWLRPLVLVPVGAILALGLLASARRPELRLVAQASLGAAAGAWFFFVASFALRRRALDRFEQALLPWASLWLLGLALFLDPRWGALAGAAAGGLALLIGLAAQRGGWGGWASLPPGRSLIVTGLLLCGASLPLAEPRGLGLAAAGLLGLHLVVRHPHRLPLLLAMALPLEGCAVALTRGGLARSDRAATLGVGLLLGALIGVAAAVALRGVDREHGEDEARRILLRWGAGLLAVGAGVTLFSTFHGLGLRWAGRGETATLLDTVALAILALTTLVTGRALRQRVLRVTGLCAMAVLGGKVLLRDLPTLGGAHLVASILLAGISALLASLLLRGVDSPETR